MAAVSYFSFSIISLESQNATSTFMILIITMDCGFTDRQY